MKTLLLNALVALFVIAVNSSVFPQAEKKPLTNTNVVEMLKAHLPENVVILSIQGSPANYDVSPSALIELNKQGVTPKVLGAMLAAQKGVDNHAQSSPADAVPVVGPVTSQGGIMPSVIRVFLLNGAE